MKKYVALWGSLFFCVICISLYLMMEAVNVNSRVNLRPNGIDENDLNSIEMKIHKVERDIYKNHQMIHEIKKILRKIAAGDIQSITKLKDLLDKEELENTEKSVLNALKLVNRSLIVPKKEVAIPESMCPVRKIDTAKADVQVRQLYELLEFENLDGGVWKQGWEITYDVNQWKTQKLQVFVVPHSHNDPGWLKTFLNYYQQQTKFIFESMLVKLEQNQEMRFIYAEISFFSLWWDELDEDKRKRVKTLINKGQLEIVTGGWVMTDEASAHYFAMLDQLIEGHQWLNGTLGIKPKSGWSIDPFGLSSVMAYFLKRMGLQNMLIQRVHYSVKKELAKKKELEFMWRQEWDNVGSTDIFCHTMPFYSYDVPHTCGPDPGICCQFDFRRLPGSRYSCPWKVAPVAINNENVAARANLLLDQYRKKSQLYRSGVVLIPLGDDFRYDKLDEWDLQFQNYQKLFDYMNSHPELRVEAKFGTLSEYFNAVYANYKVQPGTRPPGFPSLTGDFFTYADRDDHYWSGFYTSRPFQKNMDRALEHHLRAAEVIFYLALSYAKYSNAQFPAVSFMQKLVSARRNLGLFQHHDAITGTAKDFVVSDYGNRLLESLNNMKQLISEAATFLMMKNKKEYKYSSEFPIFDIDEVREKHNSLPDRSVLSVSSNPRPVLFYNSLGHRREYVIRVYVNSPEVLVRDANGNTVFSQIDPHWLNKEMLSTDVFKVSFTAAVPALGITHYSIQKVEKGTKMASVPSSITIFNSNNEPVNSIIFSVKKEPARDFSIEHSYLKAAFSGETGLLKNVTTKSNALTHILGLQFVMYGVRQSKERSGAYLFLPDGEATELLVNQPFIRIIRGPISSEVHVFFNLVQHIVRLFNSAGTDGVTVDISNIVDIRSEVNRELAMRMITDIQNDNQVFYTDLNGFQMQRRKTYSKLPLQANYYPMTTMMFIEDNRSRVSLLSAQSLGVANLKPGVVEVMLDRRLSQDDNRGLGQGVQDNVQTLNRFLLLFETRNPESKPNHSQVRYPSLLAHLASLHLIHPFYIAPKNSGSADVNLAAVFDPLVMDFTCEIHLVNIRTLQNRDDDVKMKYVPRDLAALLLHRLSFDCDFLNRGLSCSFGNGQVPIKNLFKDIKLTKIQSTSLSLMYDEDVVKDSVVIDPMEIAAFKIFA